jgi:hypothetical protein
MTLHVFSCISSSSLAKQPFLGIAFLRRLYRLCRPVSTFLGFATLNFETTSLTTLYRTPNLEDHISVFMSPSDRMAQLYPPGTGFPFHSLLRHAGLRYFNPPTHRGVHVPINILGTKKKFTNHCLRNTILLLGCLLFSALMQFAWKCGL